MASTELDLGQQARLVAALAADPTAWPHPLGEVRHLETHISHLLLTGEYAYKLKKPLDLGFLDFSSLEKRRYCCAEELRLNRRLAPALYLDVVAIGGSLAAPRLGGEPVLDYAVKMRQFDPAATLDHGPASAADIDAIALQLAEFHRKAAVAGSDSDWGTPAAVLQPALQNFDQIAALLPDLADELAPLRAWTEATHAALAGLMTARRAAGRVRECHGDLHLGNIVRHRGELLIFDGIDFNPGLRWIDVLNEIAFLAMDLGARGAPELGWRAVNRYLEHAGDYDGVALLDYYRVYRAMVRAKVAAIRAGQSGADRAAALAECRAYLNLATACTRPRQAVLLLTHGYSGSGKTTLARPLAAALQALHLRSDVERKRLAGLDPLAASGSPLGGGLYDPESGRRTYARLAELARAGLAAGLPVLVDAAFLRADQRRPFIELAQAAGVPWRILDFQASADVLRDRVAARLAAGNDASEAGQAVLAAQLAAHDAFSPAEQAGLIAIDSHTADPAALAARLAAPGALGI